jgi:hypothetical protein
MRAFPWLLTATLSMFLGGAAIAQQTAAPPKSVARPPATAKAPLTPKAVASVRQIMASMVVPSSTVVFGSVGSILTFSNGVQHVQDNVPSTDEEWTNVVNNAVVLTEAGNLLMLAGRAREKAGPIRARDRADWMMRSRELVEAGAVALKAANARDANALLDAGQRIDEACDECHERYQEGDPAPGYTGQPKPQVIIRPANQSR